MGGGGGGVGLRNNSGDDDDEGFASAFAPRSGANAANDADADAHDAAIDDTPPVETDSYYAILNVPRDATPEEIKRAYRRLAAVFHPDKQQQQQKKAGGGSSGGGADTNTTLDATTTTTSTAAQDAFARLQEAYDVLSDPAKRDTYDVYGREGLAAGLEVGPSLAGAAASAAQLRREWAAFKARAAGRERLEAAAASHRGYYMAKLDATALVEDPAAAAQLIAAGRAPPLPFRVIVAQHSVDVPVFGTAGTLHVQGQAALKGNLGSASLALGYRHAFGGVGGDDTSVEATAVLGGLRSLLTATSTRRLGKYTHASVTASWQPGVGAVEGGGVAAAFVGGKAAAARGQQPQQQQRPSLASLSAAAATAAGRAGLQLTTTRQLAAASQASLTWIVGPLGAQGMAVSAVHRGARYAVQAKLELGAQAASVSGRLSVALPPRLFSFSSGGSGDGSSSSSSSSVPDNNGAGPPSVRLAARLGTSGADVELGLARRLSSVSSAYVGTQVALAGGVTLKGRYARGGQAFEFPLALTGDWRDWRCAAVSSLAPPLAALAVSRGVARPLARWRKARRERREQGARDEAARAARRKAEAERALLAPVAARRARAEAEAGGVVIVEAVYGCLDEWRAARKALRKRVARVGVGRGGGGGGEAALADAAEAALAQGDLARVEALLVEAAGKAVVVEQEQQQGAGDAAACVLVLGGGGEQEEQEEESTAARPEAKAPPPPSLATPAVESFAVDAASSPSPSPSPTQQPHTTRQQQQQKTGEAAAAAEAAAPAPAPAGAAPAASAPPPPPPRWLDVREALQYLVVPASTGGGKNTTAGGLLLHPGVPKAGLMGFADPAPPPATTGGEGDDDHHHLPPPAPGGGPRRLYVAYTAGGELFEREVGDLEGLRISVAGGAAGGGVAAGERARLKRREEAVAGAR
jgi:hypothetical protein